MLLEVVFIVVGIKIVIIVKFIVEVFKWVIIDWNFCFLKWILFKNIDRFIINNKLLIIELVILVLIIFIKLVFKVIILIINFVVLLNVVFNKLFKLGLRIIVIFLVVVFI